MIQDTSEWDFHYVDCGKPVTVVEIKKEIAKYDRINLLPYYEDDENEQ